MDLAVEIGRQEETSVTSQTGPLVKISGTEARVKSKMKLILTD
jgi:hypothetical protein